jgi:hypothetical protein
VTGPLAVQRLRGMFKDVSSDLLGDLAGVDHGSRK